MAKMHALSRLLFTAVMIVCLAVVCVPTTLTTACGLSTTSDRGAPHALVGTPVRSLLQFGGESFVALTCHQHPHCLTSFDHCVHG